MNEHQYFKQITNAFQRTPVHNVTLLDVQQGSQNHTVLTIEYQGGVTELHGYPWIDSFKTYVGMVGYTVPGQPYETSLPGTRALVHFRPYADQSLRRVYELDQTNHQSQLVPLNHGPFPHHRAHSICAWRCDDRPNVFWAPAGLVPGPGGRFMADETVVVSVRVPPEFVREAIRVQMKPAELLESFIGDVTGINSYANNPRADRFSSNGSDERDMASAWLERAHGMNAIDLDELLEREEQQQEWNAQVDLWTDLLGEFAGGGGNAEQLLEAVSNLVDKMDELGPEGLLERLRSK